MADKPGSQLPGTEASLLDPDPAVFCSSSAFGFPVTGFSAFGKCSVDLCCHDC